MAYPGPLLLLLVPLLASFLWIGCDSGGSSPETEPPEEPPAGGGAVSFTLARAADSNVPASADSAFVRVWKPDESFNLVRFINIPGPDQRTNVTLSVPGGSNYRVGVLAVREDDTARKQILAHGSSGLLEVQNGDTSQVSLNVRPVTLTTRLPEEAQASVTDTIQATLEINIPDVSETLRARQSLTPDFSFLQGGQVPRITVPEETDSTVIHRYEFTPPSVESADTTHIKFEFTYTANANSWETPGRVLASPVFFPSEEGPSFEIPVVPNESGNGTIIITFSSDGTMTRRIVR